MKEDRSGSGVKPDKEKQPIGDQSYFVVLSGGMPRAFLFIEADYIPVLHLLDTDGKEVQGHINQLVDLSQYEVTFNGSNIFYEHRKDLNSSLSLIEIESDHQEFGTEVKLLVTSDKTEREQRAFFLRLAGRFYKDAEMRSFSDWNIDTVEGLEFLSYIYATTDKKEGLSEKIKKTFVKVPKTDRNVAYVLGLCGLEDLGGDFWFNLGFNVPSAWHGFVDGELGAFCIFPAGDFYQGNNVQRRWAIAAALGYLVKGKDFGFDGETYVNQRCLSDMVFAYFTYSSNPGWDPRGYDLDQLQERHRPTIQVLSLIWNLATPERRSEVVLALWKNGFGKEDLEKALDFVSKLTEPVN